MSSTAQSRQQVRQRTRDERGGSSSLLAAILAPALLVLVGLVVDGGGQLAAVREAQAVAAEAARAGANASPASLRGGSSPYLAKQAAQQYLDQAGVAGTVSSTGDTVTVRTTVAHETVFLGLIGVNSLTGDGEASARIIRT